MKDFWNQIQTAVWNVFNRPKLADFLDIFIMAFLIYQLIKLVRETRASAVLKGFVILLFAGVASSLLGLTTLSWLVNIILRNSVLVLIVLFQPELRKALEHLGSGSFHFFSPANQKTEGENCVREIADCMMRLSKRRVGALIVVERKIGLKDIIETGTELNARISSSLLENIFEPNTPLHDGAVIIRGTSIKAAACILTLTEKKDVSRELGTRHRAAIGVTETTDAVSLIVSEETGTISYAREGHIVRHLDRESLEKILNELFINKEEGLLPLFKEKLIRGKEKKAHE